MRPSRAMTLATLASSFRWASKVQSRQLVTVRIVVLNRLRLVRDRVWHTAVLVSITIFHHLAIVLPLTTLSLGRPLDIITGSQWLLATILI